MIISVSPHSTISNPCPVLHSCRCFHKIAVKTLHDFHPDHHQTKANQDWKEEAYPPSRCFHRIRICYQEYKHLEHLPTSQLLVRFEQNTAYFESQSVWINLNFVILKSFQNCLSKDPDQRVDEKEESPRAGPWGRGKSGIDMWNYAASPSTVLGTHTHST